MLDIEEYIKACMKSFSDTCWDRFFLERVKCSHKRADVYEYITKESALSKLDPLADTARTALFGINFTLRKYGLLKIFTKNPEKATYEEILDFCRDMANAFYVHKVE